MIDPEEDPDRVLLLELRNSAKVNRNEKYRVLAREAADQLQRALDVLRTYPTQGNFTQAIGLWALGERLLKNQPEDDPERGGQVRVESTEKIRVAA